MKKNLFIFGFSLFTFIKLNAQTTAFDNLNANPLTNKAITWTSSNYGSGFGHRIINTDPGGQTLLNFQARNNTTTWSDIMTLTSNGNVGIGTTNPYGKFHVFSQIDGAFNGLIIDNRKIYGTNTGVNETSRILLSLSENGSPNPLNRVFGIMEAGTLSGTDSSNGRLSFYVRQNGNTNEKMRISSNGHVGIGTTTPSEKLEVVDNIDGSVYIGVNNLASGSNSTSGIKLGFGTTPYDKGTFMYHKASDNTFYFSNTGDPNSKFSFITRDSSGNSVYALNLNSNGNVGIGTTTPDAKLAVKGNIHTQEVKVDLLGAIAPDYVFYKDYNLKTLIEVETFIDTNGHLPNIPSAKELETNGLYLKQMNLKLLEKIEELTLYAIGQEKELQKQKAINKDQKTINQNLEDRLQKIETLLNPKKITR